MRMRLLPEEERPRPTATRNASGNIVPLARQATKVGGREQVAGALFQPSDDGGPPLGFLHIFDVRESRPPENGWAWELPLATDPTKFTVVKFFYPKLERKVKAKTTKPLRAVAKRVTQVRLPATSPSCLAVREGQRYWKASP